MSDELEKLNVNNLRGFIRYLIGYLTPIEKTFEQVLDEHLSNYIRALNVRTADVETCEWTPQSDDKFRVAGCDNSLFINIVGKYVFCPRCGKRIVVVEKAED